MARSRRDQRQLFWLATEIVPAGDSACLVRLGAAPSGTLPDSVATARVHELMAALDANPPPGVRDLVPAYASLLVQFDPLVAGRESVAEAIRRALQAVTAETSHSSHAGGLGVNSRLVEIPVRYGGEAGPDLEEVARLLKVPRAEVVRRHAEATYSVAFLGFLAGFPYLAGLPPELAVPRLATPRTRVPAGSVALAGGQSGIYPIASPGGWRVIGQTDVVLFDPAADPPALLRPGDRVRFTKMKPQRTQRSRRETQGAQSSAKDAKERQSPTTEITEHTEKTQRSEGTAHSTLATSAISAVSPSPHPSDSATSAVNSSLSVPSVVNSGVPWLRVVRTGPLTTVQDLGRWGYARYGVSPSGAADPDALRRGNLLLGNPQDAAALEITLGGASFEAQFPSIVALAGADCEAQLDGRSLAVGMVAKLEAGQKLTLDLAHVGLRAYLCVAGGVDVPPLLGSRATDLRAGFGGLEGRALRAGDELRRGQVEPGRMGLMVGRRLPPDPFRQIFTDGHHRLRALPGPHAALAPDALAALLAGEYVVDPRSDRMGVRLRRQEVAGEARPTGGQFVSEGISPGAIQVPPDGEPILLLAERQTTGGYLIPAVVIAADLWRVGQLRPGERVRLELASEADALAALRAREDWLADVAGASANTISGGFHAPDPARLAGGFAEWDEGTDATMGDKEN